MKPNPLQLFAPLLLLPTLLPLIPFLSIMLKRVTVTPQLKFRPLMSIQELPCLPSSLISMVGEILNLVEEFNGGLDQYKYKHLVKVVIGFTASS
jgi:hypothetical protein